MEQELINEGVILTGKEKDLFKATTDHLKISYLITVDKVTIKTDSLVNIRYLNKKKKIDIKKFDILSYTVR